VWYNIQNTQINTFKNINNKTVENIFIKTVTLFSHANYNKNGLYKIRLQNIKQLYILLKMQDLKSLWCVFVKWV